MRILAFLAVAALIACEAAALYFIMPLPGSQRLRSLDAAYALHSWRWVTRIALGALVLATLPTAWRSGGWRRRLVLPAIGVAAALAWVINFRMAADRIFLPIGRLEMAPPEENRVALDRLVVGVEVDGEARAYPLQFIGYHHQVRDTVRGLELLVSYCTVCRTGRVFVPVIGGVSQRFRLVGMDHFNAMLEDEATGSWWRQANGEAITGPLKGTVLPEVPSRQVTLRRWLELYPSSRVMQGDPAFDAQYAQDYAFERGTSRSRLTGTDPRSWQEKSWVVGVRVADAERAYDWNVLVRDRVINDTLGGRPIVLAVADDSASFFVFERPDTATRFTLSGDSLRAGARAWALSGRGSAGTLLPVVASQEFWHSWRTFHPRTSRF